MHKTVQISADMKGLNRLHEEALVKKVELLCDLVLKKVNFFSHKSSGAL